MMRTLALTLALAFALIGAFGSLAGGDVVKAVGFLVFGLAAGVLWRPAK